MRISIIPRGIMLDLNHKVDEVIQPKEAQELAWKLLRAAHHIYNERKYEGQSGLTLEEYLKANPPKGEFTPNAFYNIDGNQLEVFWEDEQDWTEEIKNCGLALHRSQEDNRVIGVTIYGIQRVMSVENETNPDNQGSA